MESPMEALEKEIESQADILQRFSSTKLRKAAPGSIFVGAGDSYAAALAGFYSSGGSCIAMDPYSLAASPQTAKGLEVYLISVSGRTSANLLAAKKVRGVAARITSITAATEGGLASLTDDLVRIPMNYTPKTSGMLSFTLSLLAVLGVVKGVRVRARSFRSLLNGARRARGFSAGRGTTYFLANSLAFPAALYSAAKTYELLGEKAHAELLEEFSHLELFSLKRSDAVNVFAAFDPAGAAGRLEKGLADRGYEARVVQAAGGSDVDELFHAVFVAQLSVIAMARKAGYSKPKFLASGGRLRVSDSIIY